MCNTAILPTLSNSKMINSDVLNLTFVFNRWLKMLQRYGQLDPTSLNKDFTTISKVIKASKTSKAIKSAVANCRDYALAGEASLDKLISSLTFTLEILREAQEDKAVNELKQHYADQGMTERYRPLSKRLSREKIRKIGKQIAYTDSNTDDKATTKLVRRIIEKRAAQAVYRNAGKGVHDSNRFRQSVRRAISFSIYNSAFTDYDQQKRVNGTHWKVTLGKHGKKLKSKNSYNTYEKAIEACNNYILHHPNDTRPMSAYKCEHCGKWHIGHERVCREKQEEIQQAS